MQSLLSHRQAPVRSGTRTSSRANAVSIAHHRVATVATARRGEAAWKVSCSAVASLDDTQGSDGGRPNDQQRKPTAEGDGDEKKAQGWSRDAIQLARLVVIVGGSLAALNTFISTATGILAWYGSLPTKADLTDTERRMKDSFGDVKDSFRDVKDSLKTIVTWPYLLGGVGIFVLGRWGK